ncbi:hypothetical protein ACQPW3_23635 [Actinosynnema sp. CA-248983]
MTGCTRWAPPWSPRRSTAAARATSPPCVANEETKKVLARQLPQEGHLDLGLKLLDGFFADDQDE